LQARLNGRHWRDARKRRSSRSDNKLRTDTVSIEFDMTAEPLAFEPRAQQPRFDNCTAVQQQAIEAATFSGEVIPTSPYKAFRARQYRTERPHLDI